MIEKLKQKWKTDKRLIVKGLLWELTGLITLFIWVKFFHFGAAKTSIGYFAIRILTYYVYHKWWKLSSWLKQ